MMTTQTSTISNYMKAIETILNDSINAEQLTSKLKEYDATLAPSRIRHALKSYIVNRGSNKVQAQVIDDVLESLK